MRSGEQFCLTPDFERQVWLGIVHPPLRKTRAITAPILAAYFARPKL